MTRTNPHDPELHLLRSVAASAEGRGRTEIESARWSVWQATEREDEDEARRWIAALRAAVTTYAAESLRADGLAAIERIEARL